MKSLNGASFTLIEATQLCQDSDCRRFFRLVPLGDRHDVANDVEVVAVTNIVPSALLKRRNLIAIATAGHSA
jgi:hypothetical protein